MKLKNLKYKSYWRLLSDIYNQGKLSNLNDGFIFRGEGRDSYSLIPSALRKNNHEKLWSLATIGKPINNQDEMESWQRVAEFSLLSNFYRKSNSNGLKVPLVNMISKYNSFSSMEILNLLNTKKWLPKDLEEIAGLAQHYGVMTRLLDWTFNINIAFYFATINALRDITNHNFASNNMVIWALNYQEIDFLSSTINRIPLNFVVPPYNENPNLNAQKGILSYWESSIIPLTEIRKLSQKNYKSFFTPIDRTPLDQLLEGQTNKDKDNIDLLYKIELPITEAYKLFRFINKNGYATSSIFSGYNGVAKECNETNMVLKARDILEGKNH